MRIVITAAKRTAIGAFLGTLRDVSAVELGAVAARAVLTNHPPEDVADVVVGNVLQAGQGMNVGRQIALSSGLPQRVPGQTVNRVCGSGMQAVISAMQALRSGDGHLYLAGGTENMSAAPYLLKSARSGYRLGNGEMVDSLLSEGLTDPTHRYHMGITAENVADAWKITREEQDAFAFESQRRAAATMAAGDLADEIVPVQVPVRKAPITFSLDEHVRPDTTPEALAKLKPAFRSDGTVTAGNASGLNDGAAMLSVATEEYAQAHGLPILAEIVSYATVGVGMKPMTSSLLRRFGFRNVLVFNGLGVVLVILLCATLSPTMPIVLLLAIMVANGICRSVQFTSLNTLAFVDVEPARMSTANSLQATIQQLTMGMGVAVGALALRLSSRLHGHGARTATLGDFQMAFALVSSLALISVADYFGLPRSAGAIATAGRPPAEGRSG